MMMTRASSLPKCDTCGRFMQCCAGASWAMIYSGHPPTPDREIFRCVSCTQEHGPIPPQSGIRPEYAAGVFGEPR